MAPPIFTGFTPEMMRARVIEGARFGPNPSETVIEAVLANFRVLEDGTIQSNLRRENHLRIIDALWDHRPSQLYPTLECPVLMLPARQSTPDAMDRRFRREESIGQGGVAAAGEQDSVAGEQHPRRAVATPRTRRQHHPRPHQERFLRSQNIDTGQFVRSSQLTATQEADHDHRRLRQVHLHPRRELGAPARRHDHGQRLGGGHRLAGSGLRVPAQGPARC